MTESEDGQVINGYRWDGTQWTPIPGQVVDGYEWDGTQWTPVTGQVVDGYQWDGSQWVPATGESVDGWRWDGTGWVEAPAPAPAPAATKRPPPVRPLTRRPGFWVAVAALLGLGLLLFRLAPPDEPATSTTPAATSVPSASPTTAARSPAGTGEFVQVHVGDGPNTVVVDPASGRVYVGNSGADGNSGGDGFLVSVIEGHEVVATVPLDYAQPVGLALDAAAGTLYVSDPGGGLTLVDTATLTIRETLHLGSGGAITIGQVDRTLYIAQYERGTVAVLHLTDMTGGKATDVGKAPAGLAIDPAARRLYVSISQSSSADYTIAVVDAANGGVVDSIPIGHQPFGLALDVSEQRLYVSDPTGGISVLDLRTKRVVATIPTSGQTLAIAVDPIARELYAADYAGGTVAIVPLG